MARRQCKWIGGWEHWPCADCGEYKTRSAFGKRRSAWNGLLIYCKVCATAQQRRNYANDPDAIEKTRISSRIDTDKRGRDVINASARDRYRQTKGQPSVRTQKFVANEALKRAVYRGQITKPSVCEDCGGTFEKPRIHGHHEDYSKKLDVNWLCPQCHADRHVAKRVALRTMQGLPQ